MAKNLLITNFRRKIKNYLSFKKISYLKIFVFGSILNSNLPRDIDVLIEYPKDMEILDILEIRKELKKIIKNDFNINCDICLLNDIEHIQSRFIEHENGKRII